MEQVETSECAREADLAHAVKVDEGGAGEDGIGKESEESYRPCSASRLARHDAEAQRVLGRGILHGMVERKKAVGAVVGVVVDAWRRR